MKTNNTDSKPLGVYIHVPFCVKKCRYCDFLSFPNEDADFHAIYAAKVMDEIALDSSIYHNDYTVNTIFIGGGTPSMLAPALVCELLDAVFARFRVTDDAEITIEANPGTIAAEKLTAFRNAGITRLSLGAQSFDLGLLSMMGRIHTPEEIFSGFEAARKAGFDNINLDLIFGLPGETQKQWQRDIGTAIDLSPEHISFYSLQVEEGTEFFSDMMSGKLEALPDLEDRIMYHNAIDALADAGYAHYEISNAAKPGFASGHNLKYWSMEDYLGVGLGAHSYMCGVRSANTENMETYLSAFGTGGLHSWHHENSESEDISEYVFLGLRKTEGIDLERFRNTFGKNFWDLYAVETEMLIGRGLLERKDQTLRLTRIGLDLSNQVFAEYV
jgi:oxygen-independent coproporphyrinogen-3 oxidase